jgi:hypothetical protein
MEEIARYKDVAPYLTQPLVLVGFVLFTVFGVQRALLKAGRIPPLTPRAGGAAVRSLVRYGFVIAFLVIVLGFALALYRAEREHNPLQATSTLGQDAAVREGGTAFNIGRDLAIGHRPSPSPVENTASPSAEKESAVPSVSQDAKAEGGGIAINVGRDADIHK